MSDGSDSGGAGLDQLDFIPTRGAGLARLSAFLPRAGRWYANHGGIDHGPDRRANTAGLSPWLTGRLVTSAEALAAVEAEHGRPAVAVFRKEVEAPLRRRAWLAERPSAWRAHRLRVEGLFRSMTKSPSLLAAYDEALEGRTGIDAFDTWARELTRVGWLHPVAMRAFASLWIFSLRLPWELGADLHHRLALDGQAADLLLWREVAGLERGTAPYLVQVDELNALSGRRFQPKRRLVEEQAAALPRDKRPPAEPCEPWAAPDAAARTGWLLTEADLSAAPPPGPPSLALAALGAATHRSPFGPGERLTAWLEGAVADGLARAAAATGLHPERLNDVNWTRSLLDWASAHDLQQIATVSPTPGPVAERLAAAARRLAPDVRFVLA